MIRFFIGFILVLGGVGGMETSESLTAGLGWVAVGFALMLWALPKLTAQKMQK